MKEKVKVLVAQSCPTLCDPMDCSLPGSSVPGILQARILEGVAIPFSRRSFWPRDWTQVSCIAGRILYRLSHQESPKTLNDPEMQVWLPRNTCGCSWPEVALQTSLRPWATKFGNRHLILKARKLLGGPLYQAAIALVETALYYDTVKASSHTNIFILANLPSSPRKGRVLWNLFPNGRN